MKKTAFIDADILLHRACSFVDTEFDGEPMADWRQALMFFDHLLKNWMTEAGELKDYYLVVSTGENYRKKLYPEYKANRKAIAVHPAMEGLKEHVLSLMATVTEPGIEADDYIGIRCSEDPENTVAISADKDFATIPCTQLIPASHGRRKGTWMTFSEDEANMNWLRQALTGDTIDNYKGIPGTGPAKAEKIIPHPAPISVMWENVRLAFINARMTETDAILMAQLARILRAGDYDFETKEVKLWTP